jgi:hypothetical protein
MKYNIQLSTINYKIICKFFQVYAGDVITIRFTPKSLLRLSLDSTITNSQILHKQWSHLPLNIQKLLERRKESVLANPAGS